MPDGMRSENPITESQADKCGCYAGCRIHLIGVGGTGMRALAAMLLDHGSIVSGSDNAESGTIERLREQGAVVHIGQRSQNVPADCDMVVYSAAVNEQNPELIAARQNGATVLKYSQMLGSLMAERTGIAIAGTHGKSTTTAMVAYTLQAAGVDPSFVVGATVEQLGGPSGVGSGKHFVAEACEFDRSFLNLSPHLATILNIDEDHLDCYKDIGDIVEAFRAFSGLVPAEGVIIANGEDRYVAEAVASTSSEVQTFGLDEKCNWRGVNLQANRGKFDVDVLFNGQDFCKLAVPLPGLHNVYNSLAATAILYHAGLDAQKIADNLASFRGAHRRMTLKAQIDGVTVLDDYAHHPTEIQATLKAIREHYQPKRLICVFQPHQHSRTRFLLKDFARCFGSADEVIVPDIYFVRDSIREKDYISSQDLVAQIRLNGGAAIYLEKLDDIVSHMEHGLRGGDLVVTMGAGNIWEVADEIVCWLRENS